MTMANMPPKWANSEAKELLEKDLRIGRIPVEGSEWTPKRVYNLPDHPQFRLFEYNKFVTNLRNLRNRIKVLKQAGSAASLALVHDQGIYRVAAINNQQGGANHWEGSLAQEWLNVDMDEGKHEMMQPKQLRATREACKKFEKGVFAKHIYQEVRTHKFLVYLKEKDKKKKEKEKKKRAAG
jgi:hypothetical protein